MTPSPSGPARRAVLGGIGAVGLGGAVAGCSGADGTGGTGDAAPTATPTPTASPTETERPFVPEGLDESQRTTYSYGENEAQVTDLWMPAGEHRDALVVLVHGGGYAGSIDRRDFNGLVADLVGRGWPVLNLDYRGLGNDGGWTGTFTDVAAALDTAADAAAEKSLPLENLLVLGHSAGGHLALWSAARRNLPSGAPGADPKVVPAFAGAMAGVCHPTALATPEGDQNVVAVFGGTAAEVDQHYALGDPTRLVPFGMPLFVIHGRDDGTVPNSQSQEFADAATGAGDPVQFQIFEGMSHADPQDVTGPMWAAALAWIESSTGA